MKLRRCVGCKKLFVFEGKFGGAKRRRCRVCTLQRAREQTKVWLKKHVIRVRKLHREWARKHPEVHKAWCKRNPVWVKEHTKKYYKKHRKNHLALCKRYRDAHREDYYRWRKERLARLPKSHPVKIKNAIRTRIWKTIHAVGSHKFYKTEKLLGCSISFFKKYIEKQFKKGMSWENQGEWDIHHKIPCSSFDLSKAEEQLKCFHYSNHQPLWEIDHREEHERMRRAV